MKAAGPGPGRPKPRATLATMRGLRALALAALWAILLAAGMTGTAMAAEPAPPVGPPFPPPVTGQRVYDFAAAFDPQTRTRAQQIADAIETRTAAQVVIYTQLKPSAIASRTESDARALIDQWGIGRRSPSGTRSRTA